MWHAPKLERGRFQAHQAVPRSRRPRPKKTQVRRKGVVPKDVEREGSQVESIVALTVCVVGRVLEKQIRLMLSWHLSWNWHFGMWTVDERNTVRTPFFRLSDQCLYCKLTRSRSNVILTMMTAGGLGRSRRCLNSIIMVFGVWVWAFCCLGNGGRFESAPVWMSWQVSAVTVVLANGFYGVRRLDDAWCMSFKFEPPRFSTTFRDTIRENYKICSRVVQVKDEMSSTGQRKPEVSQMASAMSKICTSSRDILIPQTESSVICPGFFLTNSAGVHNEWNMQFCSCVCVSTVGVGAASFLRLIEDSRPGYSSIPSSLEEKVEPVLDKHKAGAMKGRLWHMAFWNACFCFSLRPIICTIWFRVGSVWRFRIPGCRKFFSFPT